MPELSAATADSSISGTEKLLTTDFETVTLQQVADANESKSSSIASAATVDLSTATAAFVHITGSTGPITSFGTVQSGTRRVLVFDSTPTITHDATSLILPTGANIVAAAGDCAVFISEGSGNWRCVSYQRASGQSLAGSGSTAGKHSIPIMAGSMSPSATGGCASLATIASAANQPDIQTLDFDASTEEYAQFAIPMPKSWNEGTVTAQFRWSHASTTTNFGVVWGIQAVAVGDDDAIAVSYGTAQTVADTGGTTNDLYVTSETSAITIAGTPAAQDTVYFRVYRATANGSDTMAIDARLHSVVLFVTTDADTDA